MKPNDLSGVFKTLSKPLDPIPVSIEARLAKLPGVRCVLFDIYGTLIISGSGDVGTAGALDEQTAMDNALSACDVDGAADRSIPASRITDLILEDHRKSKLKGVEYPEVDIVEIWGQLLTSEGVKHVDRSMLQQLAIEYDARTNPVWPMPGMENILTELKARRMKLGIVSNAQFYTPLLFPAFTGKTLRELGFDEELCVWSYRYREAKPSQNLFRTALTVLDDWGVRPDEVVYVGNDMRNDIWPSSELGCRTALFAGDQRALRLREEDPQCRDVKPDVIITALPQLLECLPTGDESA